MFKNIWNLLFGSATDDFGPSSDNRMAQVIKNLSSLPIPPLDDPFFKNVFAITWAMGILLGLVVGWISALFIIGKSMRDVGTVVPLAARWTFFLQVAVVGFIAPPATAAALYVGDGLADAANKLPDAQQRLPNLISFGDVIMNGFITLFEWLFGVILEGESALLTASVFPALALTPVFYGLSIAGSVGLGLWRFWVAVLALTVTAKPILAWTLSIGNVFAAWLQGANWGATASWLALGTMVFAAALPFIMLALYKKKAASVGPALVAGSSNDASDVGQGQSSRPRSRNALLTGSAAGLNTIAARQASRTPGSAPRTPGDRRIMASSALRAGAHVITKTHPAVAVASTALSMGVGASGRRAQARAQAAPPPIVPAPTGRAPREPHPPADMHGGTPPAREPRQPAPRMQTAAAPQSPPARQPSAQSTPPPRMSVPRPPRS